jgi:bifunctional DNA-binding transcriptional regulator/antitoxin component of YhaV-PrlF toxin-antitoxin module
LVRLQKHFAYRYKDKEHYKHVVTIPEETVEQLGWKEGDELEQTIEKDSLIIKEVSRSAKRR